MKTIATVLANAFLIAGCATAGKMNRIELGMTKQQVIQTIGKPVSVSAQGGSEYLNYSLSETSDDAMRSITRPYYVRLVGGKVESFGRTGDFDSTRDPTMVIKTDNTMRNDQPQPDRYDRLSKLNELRKSGAITEEEYQAEKARIMQ